MNCTNYTKGNEQSSRYGSLGFNYTVNQFFFFLILPDNAGDLIGEDVEQLDIVGDSRGILPKKIYLIIQLIMRKNIDFN